MIPRLCRLHSSMAAAANATAARAATRTINTNSAAPRFPTYPTHSPTSTHPPFPYFPRLSVAPMVDVTDTHYRVFCRLLSAHVALYSPMHVDQKIIAMHRQNLLQPLFGDHGDSYFIAQLAGRSAPQLIEAANILYHNYGVREININMGCPAESAQKNEGFGVVLMLYREYPDVLRQLRASLPADCRLTIKCRIGVDEMDSLEFLIDFVEQMVTVAGIDHFIVHARKALLGLSPIRNRTVPPIDYGRVYALREKYPNLIIEINGEFTQESQLIQQYEHGMNGCMIGRGVWKNIYSLHEADQWIYNGLKRFGPPDATGPEWTPMKPPSRKQAVELYAQYIEDLFQKYPADHIHAPYLPAMLTPLEHLYAGWPFRKHYTISFTALRQRIKEGRDVFLAALRDLPVSFERHVAEQLLTHQADLRPEEIKQMEIEAINHQEYIKQQERLEKERAQTDKPNADEHHDPLPEDEKAQERAVL